MARASLIGLFIGGGIIIAGLYFMAMADNETTDQAESAKMKKGLKLLAGGVVVSAIAGIALKKSI